MEFMYPAPPTPPEAEHQHQGTVQLLLMPLSSTAASVKSNKWDEGDGEECESVPLPIQTFLWRQTNPFLGAKIGKLHEASCVTFERVVVQNILHGLSPSLSDAISSVSRWRLVRASFPHLIQCCGALLEASGGQRPLSNSIQKILYILHWMILDSAAECLETEAEKQPPNGEKKDENRLTSVFSVSSMQLFVYLITPLIDVIKPEDVLDNIRLENGIGIWSALWQYRTPDVLCFCAPVKQRRDAPPFRVPTNLFQSTGGSPSVERSNGSVKPLKNVAGSPPTVHLQQSTGIYLGEDDPPKPRRSSVIPPPKPPRSDPAVQEEKRRKEEERRRIEEETERQLSLPPPGPPPPVPTIAPPTLVPAAKPIVRSVSEYRTSEMAGEVRNKMHKSKTTAFDSSPTSSTSSNRMNEMDCGLTTIVDEQQSLSRVFAASDDAPLVQLHDICSMASMEASDYKLKEEGPSEVVCQSCGRVLQRDSVALGACECNGKTAQVGPQPPAPPIIPPLVIAQRASGDETQSSSSVQTIVPQPTMSGGRLRSDLTTSTRRKDDESSEELLEEVEEYPVDPTVATYLDVAVLRALLIRQWSEEGVHWGLRFLQNRLSDVQTYLTEAERRPRSNSLPTIKRNKEEPHADPSLLGHNTTWSDLQPLSGDSDTEDKRSVGAGNTGKLHVAFKDKRSYPSLNNSVELLSMREESPARSPGGLTRQEPANKFYPEAIGCSNFIERNGKISFTVIVQVIDQVMERSPVVRLCEIALTIADILLRTPSRQSTDFFAKLTNMVFRIYVSLGCQHGCNDGVRSSHGDFLRAKARNLLATLERHDAVAFRGLLIDYVTEKQQLQDTLDLLHAITAFCRAELPGDAGRRASEMGKAPSYRNAFNEKDKGIEGRIIDSVLKALITKLVNNEAILQQPENMSTFQDVRVLVAFIAEQHGNPMRRVALSALLEVAKCVATTPSSNNGHTTPRHRLSKSSSVFSSSFNNDVDSSSFPGLSVAIPAIAFHQSIDDERKDESSGSGKSSPGSTLAANSGQSLSGRASEHASLRRGLFKKREKSSQNAEKGENGESDADSPSTPRSVESRQAISDDTLSSAFKKRSTPKLHFAFNLLKVRSDHDSDNDNDEPSDAETVDDFDSTSYTEPKDSIQNAFKKKSFFDNRGCVMLWGILVPPAKLLTPGAIFEGTRRFAFLLETARPGSFPDAPLVAALLHLKSPVLSRAALLLECAHFVSRCNRGDWPEWIRCTHSRTLSLAGAGALANRGTPSATRRMHSLQRAAGRHFYHWALQVGEQLSKMLDAAEKSTEEPEPRMKDVLEDFMDEGMVNESGSRCPLALQLVAAQLLLEVTAFLRESFRTIPRSKSNGKQAGPPSGWDKLLSHRRWSILSNTFNPHQTGSITSVADINPSSLHLTDQTRRISLSTAEEDSPRGSRDPIDPDKKAGGSSEGSGRRLAQGRQRLLKRGSPLGQQQSLENSKRRHASFKLRKQSKQPAIHDDPESEVMPATTVPPVSREHEAPVARPTSATIGSEPVGGAGTASSSVAHGSSSSKPATAPGHSGHDDEEEYMVNNMPWIKVLIRMTNSFDTTCTHEGRCSSNCFARVQRQCMRLMTALDTVYQNKRENRRVDKRKLLLDKYNSEQQALRRSLHSRQSAVVPRRESAFLGGGHREPSSMAIKALLMEKMMAEKAAEKDTKGDKEDPNAKKSSVENEEVQEDEDPTVAEPESNQAMIGYMRAQVLDLVHSPLSTVLKGAILLQPDDYTKIIRMSWRLLLDPNPHVVVTAASTFTIACVKRAEEAVGVARAALESKSPTERSHAIQRFHALWRNRYHVWLKMEDGAQAIFKVAPPGIDFTSPSPQIGEGQGPVVDPPWLPHHKTKVEQLSLTEEEQQTSQTIMTMTRTRRKQKQEMARRAVKVAEEKHRTLRQQYQLRGAALLVCATYDRMLFAAPTAAHDIEEGESHPARAHLVPIAQPFLPSSLLSLAPTIVELLDDPQVDANGVSVGDVAKKVVWQCLVEEPTYFLRHFLEKMTNRENQIANDFRPSPQWEYLMSLLRKLILHFNPFPSNAACHLLNNLFGYVMHYVRASCEGSQKAMSMALSLLSLLGPYVTELYFKDLKQGLKKEQCDQALMMTANVPSAKKVVVHGPDSGAGGIPSQFPVHEDTQFLQILTDSIEFFNIEDSLDEGYEYVLADSKTGIVHSPSSYVRDFYFFHRSFYPQLTLLKLSTDTAQLRMKDAAFVHKFIDVGKVLLTYNILKHSPQNVIAQRIFFLHDELTHLPAFPRKAIDSCFGMYNGEMGEQLKAMDSMHKYVWAKLMSDMFERMENAFMFADLHLFINVINGIIITHCEDVLILRRCTATYIAMVIHFNSLFASQGFFLIMPTLLRCYSQRQTNKVFCEVVEFLCRQFYILHRKPFLLQMCGSIANIIDNNDNDFEINPTRVKAKYWFALLKSMESMSEDVDRLDILGLVPYPKPLKALDLCYRDDVNSFCLLKDALASCICVCAFAPESRRSHHMLLVMHALLPHFLRSMEDETSSSGNAMTQVKHEISQYATLCVEMKALVMSCETLARGPQRTFDLVNTVSERGKSFIADSPQFFDPPTINDDAENAKPYHLKEKKSTAMAWDSSTGVEEQQKELFRRPRDTMLQLIASFIEYATPRLKELTKLSPTSEHTKIPDVLDHKCHVKLSEIALALLKVAPYDLATLSCNGLQKYFLTILSATDWSIESNRPALTIILRRLDKTIVKIAKKQSIRRRVNWAALSNWLRGICDTLSVFPYIAHLHPLKTITQVCLRIVAGDPCNDEGAAVSALHPSTVLHASTPPPAFAQATLKLTSILMQALGQFVFSLEFVCSPDGMGTSAERLEAVLCHVLIPLFLRTASSAKAEAIKNPLKPPGSNDSSIIQAKDITFVLNLMMNAICPPVGKPAVAPLMSTSTIATTFMRGTQDISGRQGSVSVTDKGHSATVSTHRIVRDSVVQSIYLALKVLMLTFDKLLTPLWPKVAKIVKELVTRRASGALAVSLGAFVEFLLTCNLPVALMALPIVHAKLKQKPSGEQEAAWMAEIQERLHSYDHVTLSNAVQLARCTAELASLKEELASKPIENARSYTPTMTGDPHSDASSSTGAQKAKTAPGAAQRNSLDRRSSSHGRGRASGGHAPARESEIPIPEGEEDDEGNGGVAEASGSRVSASSSAHKDLSRKGSYRSGFGVWRSIRRKSRHVSSLDSVEKGGESAVELVTIPSCTVEKTVREGTPKRNSSRRSTDSSLQLLQLHEQPPPATSVGEHRQRFVSFSTPKRDDDGFHIIEQHHVV
ncbi:hypothetical protein PMAYCL1PPCAC_11322 [Pristionchus mayeri]|uniref:Unc-80 n=1 Tax=Pristionchus mayeri TaxID=1317129 RepID=A0AAN4ZMS6_9BILA|nr:hypothetical protein PMAYCL1PPCAC_11322 [Pristionchus mayeri]